MLANKKVVELHDRSLLASIEQFLNQKKQLNKNTHRSYLNDIKQFFNIVFEKEYDYITEEEFNGEKTSLDSIFEYFNYLYESEDENGERLYSNGTINRKQSSIKSLLKFLKIKKVYYGDLSELELIRNLPKDTKSIEVLTVERALQYVDWIRGNERFKSEEKCLIIKLAIETGLRASELLSLEWNQFKEDDSRVLIKGYGKGNKKWVEKMGTDLYNELRALNNEGERVFSLSYSDLAKMMLRAKKALGDEKRAITFHSFKKCAVSFVYKVTGDILEAQKKGKHSSLDTTRIYLEEEDYGITGAISLIGKTEPDLYKKVDKKTLTKAIELMNKDFLFILNNKINDVLNGKKY